MATALAADRFETFDLPAHWASALINGDSSGLDAADHAALDAFLEREGAGRPMFDAVDVSEDSWFAWRNDAMNLGATVATFTFRVAL